MARVNGSTASDDVISFDALQAESSGFDLGEGYDVVTVNDSAGVDQVRLTFTSSQVGNGNPNDSNNMTNQDGGLAVRFQAEGEGDVLTGPVSRFDDEGISFVATGGTTFDVRDLVSGAQRGDQFGVVRLGTMGDDFYDERQGPAARTYINAGMGNDFVIGGVLADFLVGGAGDDRLLGGAGDDSYIGGAGNDTITDTGNNGRDVIASYNLSTDGADSVNLGGGIDRVFVSADASVSQYRITFTSSQVGNNVANDSFSMPNQDGGLAVRLQAEDGTGEGAGNIGRFDDEGMVFIAARGDTFDVRDLVSGTARGDTFQVVQLGTSAGDSIDRTDVNRNLYINAGMGNDRITGGNGNDFLVGGAGDDRLNGGVGDDSLLGGGGADRFLFLNTRVDGASVGSDRILDFVSGTDTIDLRSFRIDFEDVNQTMSGTDTILSIDTNNDVDPDLFITLVNSGPIMESDFAFAGGQTPPTGMSMVPQSDFLV